MSVRRVFERIDTAMAGAVERVFVWIIKRLRIGAEHDHQVIARGYRCDVCGERIVLHFIDADHARWIHELRDGLVDYES